MCELCIIKKKLLFFCHFYKFEAAPLHFSVGEDENWFVSEIGKNGGPWPLTLHAWRQPAAPWGSPALRHAFCQVAHLHTKNSSGRVCTCITSQYSVLTE